MADTSLILHVKGTESETATLPKNVVRAGISEGKITHSQLIWIPGENTWKPVKELPELLPGERLILHVKGTESETQELPKAEVRAGISQGKITHSQLIWIPAENTWKPVRELPDLLPGETLILHVKGTQAETTELPKKAVQAGVSKGQITHSQLIWIPNESTWKPVRELPDLLPGERLILACQGHGSGDDRAAAPGDQDRAFQGRAHPFAIDLEPQRARLETGARDSRVVADPEAGAGADARGFASGAPDCRRHHLRIAEQPGGARRRGLGRYSAGAGRHPGGQCAQGARGGCGIAGDRASMSRVVPPKVIPKVAANRSAGASGGGPNGAGRGGSSGERAAQVRVAAAVSAWRTTCLKCARRRRFRRRVGRR